MMAAMVVAIEVATLGTFVHGVAPALPDRLPESLLLVALFLASFVLHFRRAPHGAAALGTRAFCYSCRCDRFTAEPGPVGGGSALCAGGSAPRRAHAACACVRPAGGARAQRRTATPQGGDHGPRLPGRQARPRARRRAGRRARTLPRGPLRHLPPPAPAALQALHCLQPVRAPAAVRGQAPRAFRKPGARRPLRARRCVERFDHHCPGAHRPRPAGPPCSPQACCTRRGAERAAAPACPR